MYKRRVKLYEVATLNNLCIAKVLESVKTDNIWLSKSSTVLLRSLSEVWVEMHS